MLTLTRAIIQEFALEIKIIRCLVDVFSQFLAIFARRFYEYGNLLFTPPNQLTAINEPGYGPLSQNTPQGKKQAVFGP